MKVCIRCFVAGRVQGVWFRAATREQAQRLNVCGYARNLSDGRVEVLACGEQEKVAALQQWLWEGPPHARVDAVAAESVDYEEFDGFSIA